jgi:dTDP-D-glucose 4,6-dehydratase
LFFQNTLEFTQVNVKGTHVMLESSRLCNIKRFVHVSTDEVYGSTDVDEAEMNTMLEPTNPYACSKLAAECIIKAYEKSFRLPIIISRGNNVYGPNQFLEKVIPRFISRLLKERKY